tara:strand:- start:1863 stop:2873 length:1011 start_codon:yes stop_codon:yes gene_type:complete
MSIYTLGLNDPELALLSHCCAESAQTLLMEVVEKGAVKHDVVANFFKEEVVDVDGDAVLLTRSKSKDSLSISLKVVYNAAVMDACPEELPSKEIVTALMKIGKVRLGPVNRDSDETELPMPMGLVDVAHGSSGSNRLVDETGYVSRFSHINFHSARVYRDNLQSSKKTDYSNLMGSQHLVSVNLSPKQFAKVARANGVPTAVTLCRYLGDILPEPDKSIEFSEQTIRKEGTGVDPALEKALESAMDAVVTMLTPVKAITSKKASAELTTLLQEVSVAYSNLAVAMQEQRRADMQTLLSGYMEKFQIQVEESVRKLPPKVQSKVDIPSFGLLLNHTK